MIKVIEYGKQVSDAFDIDTLGIRAHSYAIGAAELQTNYIEIPGRDGALDLTEALGKLSYRNRVVKFSALYFGSEPRWHTMISELLNRFDGRILKVIFDNDPEHFWTGRCAITHERVERELYGVTFTITADPYKYGLHSTTDDWLWDPFNFDSDVIRVYKNITVNGTKDVRVIGFDRELTPTIISSAAMTLKVRKNGKVTWDEYALTAGQNVLDGLSVISQDPHEDYYTFKFTGTGTVSISMTEVSL